MVERGAHGPTIVFFDGGCGLCHAWVRFALARDRRAALRFAPIGGETFRSAVPEALARSMPDSVVVRTADGALLTRSHAALHVLAGLGGAWPLLARLLALVPTRLRDGTYDAVARLRRRFGRTPAERCPAVPEALRGRFLA